MQVTFLGIRTHFTIREHNRDWSVYSRRRYTIGGYAFAHDLAITRDSVVLLQNAVQLHLGPFLAGRLCLIHCLRYQPTSGLQAHVIPRSHDCHGPDLGSEALGASMRQANVWQRRRRKRMESGVSRSRCCHCRLAQQQRCSLRPARATAHNAVAPAPTCASGREAASASRTASKDCAVDVTKLTPHAQAHRWAHSAHVAARAYTLPPRFVTHIANAWSHGSRLQIVCVAYPAMPDFLEWSGPGRNFEDITPEGQPPSILSRFSIDTSSTTDDRRCSDHEVEQVSKRVMEFPCVHPGVIGAPNRYVIAAAARPASGNAPPQLIAVYDTLTGEVQSWGRGEHYFPGDPCFVPRLAHTCEHGCAKNTELAGTCQRTGGI